MELVEFPKDFPVDEHAVVLDSNLFATFNPGEHDGAIIYTTRHMTRSVEESFFNLLRKDEQFRRVFEIRGGASLPVLQQYKILKDHLRSLRDSDMRGRHDTKFLISEIDMYLFFTFGEGFIVDEEMAGLKGDQQDIFADRVKYYKEVLRQFSDYVPKMFLAANLEHLKGMAKKEDAALDLYRTKLGIFDSSRRLTPVDRNELEKDIIYFAGDLNVLDIHDFENDLGLAALAYSLPAKNVSVFSNDSDIRALTIFPNRFFEDGPFLFYERLKVRK